MKKKMFATIIMALMLVTIISMSSVQSRTNNLSEKFANKSYFYYGTLSVGVYNNITGEDLSNATVIALQYNPYKEYQIPFNFILMKYVKLLPPGFYIIKVIFNGQVSWGSAEIISNTTTYVYIGVI